MMPTWHVLQISAVTSGFKNHEMGNRAINVSEQIEKLKSEEWHQRRIQGKGSFAWCRILPPGVLLVSVWKNLSEQEQSQPWVHGDGTDFDDIVKLCYFDFKLRNLPLKCLNRIEINFRTYLSCYVSYMLGCFSMHRQPAGDMLHHGWRASSAPLSMLFSTAIYALQHP